MEGTETEGERRIAGQFSGADWVKENYKVEPSALGRKVADVLGFVWRGIYHLDEGALSRVKWDDDYVIRFVCGGDLATWDFNRLTELVVLCHDQCLRLDLQGIGPRRMQMLFHGRQRAGGASQRHPTIEDAVLWLRKEAYGRRT